MKKFKTFFEETEIESLEALIANPDPSRVKMYGGGTAYVDMLKKKLERAKKSQAIQSHLKQSPLGRAIEDEEVEELKQEEFINRYNDFGIKYKGYHLEVEQDEEPNERYFYYGTIYNPQGKSIQLPDRDIGAGSEDFVTTMGSIKAEEFKKYIDSISAGEEDAEKKSKFKIYKGKDYKVKVEKGKKFTKNGIYMKVYYQNPSLSKARQKQIANQIHRAVSDEEHVEDAQDRCKRKADQVYGKKTSAYKSGAIVRCRQGKIWKKK